MSDDEALGSLSPPSLPPSARPTHSLLPPLNKRDDHRWILLCSTRVTPRLSECRQAGGRTDGRTQRSARIKGRWSNISDSPHQLWTPTMLSRSKRSHTVNASRMNGTAAATGSASCRFAHYFVVCGVDTETGLELDDGAGRWSINMNEAIPLYWRETQNALTRLRLMSCSPFHAF